MHKLLIIFALASSTCVAADADINDACHIKVCSAGDRAITYFKKDDPYYACASKELSEYVNFVIGLVSTSIQFTGQMPAISPKTGEPEYLDGKDGPNKTRMILDLLRKKAGVATLDQAMAQCTKGSPNIRVSVMNNPADSQAIWVIADKSKKSFWMPKSHLTKK
ncbi:hypothetical protein GJ699_02385 [Duganella sp. FT80W]|uniref:Uncharacterized protein n=1 Tax=Duganella guangzhouensis TaxID=2666084 RepID=A0A6I2KSV3_9BURK|nr:hypothetical protein [Duganella guangzhouensis]MRW88828.1 hypothetical protein [Duganella guangzhouensis]